MFTDPVLNDCAVIIRDDGFLNYRDRHQMKALAGWLRETPPAYEPLICALIVDRDLMRPRWWMRLALWAVRLRHGNTAVAWRLLKERTPGVCRELIDATAEWVVNGKDRTTRDAAGGLNDDEATTLAAGLAYIGRLADGRPGA